MRKKYQVVKGDSLWGLAERFYGDGRLYPVISDHIKLGKELEIPYVGQQGSSKSGKASAHRRGRQLGILKLCRALVRIGGRSDG